MLYHRASQVHVWLQQTNSTRKNVLQLTPCLSLFFRILLTSLWGMFVWHALFSNSGLRMNFVFLVSLQTRNRMFRVLGFLSLSRSSITSYLSTDWPKAFQCLSLLCFFYPELEMPPARWLVCPEPRVVDYCRAWLSRQRQAILVERPRAVTARTKQRKRGTSINVKSRIRN